MRPLRKSLASIAVEKIENDRRVRKENAKNAKKKLKTKS